MATPSAAIVCAVLALALWMPIGWLIARRLALGADLRLAATPILGWAVQNIISLQASMLVGFSTFAIISVTVLVGVAALIPPAPTDEPTAPLPLWALAAAAVVAIGPALGVMPKLTPDGIALAAPIYDHAKIALVDEMVRTGVPPANPFIGGGGVAGTTAYYYFWLFGAAQLALVSGARGWEADVAATWFTAFASLSLMCGLAFRLSNGRGASIAFVLVAALGGSLRPMLTLLFGQDRVDGVLERATGLAGWFFQTSWSPHHVAAATTVLLALLIMAQLTQRATAAATIALACLAAAGFGSSLWVGGVTFALCASTAGLVLVCRSGPGSRLPFLIAMAIATCVAIILVLPLLLEQLHAAVGRSDVIPVRLFPYPVLASPISAEVRQWLDLPAYWLVLLPIEFPAIAILGTLAAVRLKDPLTAPLAVAALTSFCIGGLTASTVGENNDLGWRAVLPGVLILTAFAGAGLALTLARRSLAPAFAGFALLILALPDGLRLLHGNAVGSISADAAHFRDAPALWAAVREQTAPAERIASNPRMTSSLVPWPISLSWALLADRRSCFAGSELALAFTPLPPDARAKASALFDRVFAGAASDTDLDTLVQAFDCRVFVLTPEDGAWNHDPFAASPLFTQVADAPDRWRIYRTKP